MTVDSLHVGCDFVVCVGSLLRNHPGAYIDFDDPNFPPLCVPEVIQVGIFFSQIISEKVPKGSSVTPTP